MITKQSMQLKYLVTFLVFLLAYALIILVLSQEGDIKFEHLHLMLDTGNGILSLLLALFLLAEQYNIDDNVRQYLTIGFGLAALTEILHALVGIEWSGYLSWIQTYAHALRPATWPPSTYVLPLSITWLLYLKQRQILLPSHWFAIGMIVITIVLFAVSWWLPKYVDTGILGIQRPTQIPLLLLWAVNIRLCWRIRTKHPLYEGIVWMGVMLLLSDVCMLYSTSPHEKFTMMAHSGKFLSYTLLHIIQMRVAAADSQARKLAEYHLRIAATIFESQQGMMITDANQVILRVNQAFTLMTGYNETEVIGKNPRLLQSGKQNASFYATMWKSIQATDSWEGEVWSRRKNGEIYPEYLTITAVKDPNNRVTNYVATLSDITANRAAVDEIERLAFYDPLTSLPNRRLLLERLRLALITSFHSGRKGALLFIDLDNFKTLNDTLGHNMGDLLLQQVAERLSACVRQVDTVARLGGDEFVVMLENLSDLTTIDEQQAQIVGNKILDTLNQTYLLDTHHYQCTPSIGITLFEGHEKSINELLMQADIAMYHAKTSGRNALCFFHPTMQENIAARAELEFELRQALAKNQFIMYYQLQTTHSNQPVGAELLMRWQHPQRGLILPMDFIPLAEETGLIVPMGQWMLGVACDQLKRWENHERTQHLQLAVNVSARQFRQADFVEQVLQIVHGSGINPNKLKLELTESLVLDNIDDAILKMQQLRAAGIHFSMDDFGTGQSSLASLKKLPIDQLKIDRSFVSGISIDPSDTVLVQTIIAMANNLGLEIIAEGVETEAQRCFLEQHDCQLCQGYLFGKPMPVEAFETLIHQPLS